MNDTPPAPVSKIERDIIALATKYAADLKEKINARTLEMESDDDSHYLLYQVLGIAGGEGKRIDVYQNTGRFLYQNAGTFLEKAAKLCFLERFPGSKSVRIKNTQSDSPKTFQIDCLIEERDAIEIKWRDATTDGDHINKERQRLQETVRAGYKPIRVMFYFPNRTQAIRIQKTLEVEYAKLQGEYHCGAAAWNFVAQYTGVNLKAILERIAKENAAA